MDECKSLVGGGGGRRVLVASTHLFWDPAHADVKLAQTNRLLAEAGKFLADNALTGVVAGDTDEDVPVVIAGDFNSVPGSEVHARMLAGIAGIAGGAQRAQGGGGVLRPSTRPVFTP